MRGNVLDLAVGVIIGAAFQAIVTSLTSDIISPILGIFGGVNFDQFQVTINGATIMYGKVYHSGNQLPDYGFRNLPYRKACQQGYVTRQKA